MWGTVISGKEVDHQLYSRELAMMWERYLRHRSRLSVTFQGISSEMGTVISDKEVDHQVHSRELAVMWKRSSQAKK